jgi:hypothetical protein
MRRSAAAATFGEGAGQLRKNSSSTVVVIAVYLELVSCSGCLYLTLALGFSFILAIPISVSPGILFALLFFFYRRIDDKKKRAQSMSVLVAICFLFVLGLNLFMLTFTGAVLEASYILEGDTDLSSDDFGPVDILFTILVGYFVGLAILIFGYFKVVLETNGSREK